VQDAIDPIPVAGAEGRHFWDYDGKRYLDFASQLVNVSIGHQHPKIVAAIKEQAEKLATIGPPMANESRSQLGRLLAEVTPGDLCMSDFTNSGAEANENAIKLARLYTGRQKIIARYRSYHGATHGGISLTGDPRRWPTEPGMPGVVRMLDPYTYRCPAGHPDPCPVCTGAPHLEEILQYEGPRTVAAVFMETVTGTNGVIPPPEGYLQAIREVCDRHGIVLVFDEVMAGFGRTGRWFACENWDVLPDIVTVAKGINSGYVPLGAMIFRKHLADWVRDKYFPGGLTYAGHPLACASAVASIEAFREEGVVENAAEVGAYLGERLRELAGSHPSIGEVRGLGCFWGIELVKNRETREMLVPFNASGEAAAPAARLVKAALQRGLYLMTHWNVIMVVPPLTITRDEVDVGIAILDEVLTIADEHVTS
ncbi:MAG: aminotransferase class III-fold pyridoxal phosphate-dependent enzyme, partial [Gaiellaceae bacterium]